jgi:hypothetical protein
LAGLGWTGLERAAFFPRVIASPKECKRVSELASSIIELNVGETIAPRVGRIFVMKRGFSTYSRCISPGMWRDWSERSERGEGKKEARKRVRDYNIGRGQRWGL